MFVVSTPEVFPVFRLLHVLLVEAVVAQSLGHLSNGPVAEGIFDGAVAGTVDAVGNVSVAEIFDKTATTFGFLITSRRNGSIYEHTLQGILPIDTGEPLGVGVGDDNLGIAAALRTTIAITAACIGHVAVAMADVEEGIDDVDLTLWIEQGY